MRTVVRNAHNRPEPGPSGGVVSTERSSVLHSWFTQAQWNAQTGFGLQFYTPVLFKQMPGGVIGDMPVAGEFMRE